MVQEVSKASAGEVSCTIDMNISLRAHGLSALLKQRSLSMEDILSRTTDTQVIVENTLRELKNKGLVETKVMIGLSQGTVYKYKEPPVQPNNRELLNRNDTNRSQAYIEQSSFFQRMFPNNKPYEIIEWFFEVEGKDFEGNEEKLEAAAKSLYYDARMMFYWNRDRILKNYELYKEHISTKKNDDVPSLQGLFRFAETRGL